VSHSDTDCCLEP